MVEFLSEDILEHDFITAFSPIHITQKILGSVSVNIKDNFVTTKTSYQKLFTFICICLATGSLSHFLKHFYETFYQENITLYCTCSFGIIIQYVSYIINILHSSFNGEKSKQLYLITQKIDHHLDYNDLQSLYKFQYKTDLFMVMLLIICFLIGAGVHVSVSIPQPILTVFLFIALSSVYIDIVLLVSLIRNLGMRLTIVNKVLKSDLHNIKELAKTPSSVSSSAKLDCNKIYSCVAIILESMELITDIFSFVVFNIVTMSFVWTFLVIEGVVIGLRTKLYSITEAMTLILWIFMFVIILTVTGGICEWFVAKVKSTKVLCIHILSVYQKGPIRKMAKKILRAMEYKKITFSVYGIFTLDGRLIIKLFTLVTSNVLVMIQLTVQ